MIFWGAYGPKEELVELEVKQADRNDVPLMKEWLRFAGANKPKDLVSSSLCMFLGWDTALANSHILEGNMFKLVSRIQGRERIEGILYVYINRQNEVCIEGLEAAPWNREAYLKNEREFRLLGMILIGYAIIYGNQMGTCGTIRLESLDVRRHYNMGLEMQEISHGEFIYTKEQAEDFLNHLIELGFIPVKEV